MSGNGRETEVALMICDDHPEAIAEEIARLDAIGAYSLGDAESIPIRDVMFDTAERTLGTRGYVLRARSVGHRDVLTLKGESRVGEWGGVQRLEIEGAADEETVRRIAVALRNAGIALPFPAAIPGNGVKTLRAAGLHAIQDRQTLRQSRRLLDGGAVFGELSVDRVSVSVGRRLVSFFQVEVEAKGAERGESLRAVVGELEARFGDKLGRWHYGKTAIIFALIRAAPAGLDALENDSGVITVRDCRRIREILEGGEPAGTPPK